MKISIGKFHVSESAATRTVKNPELKEKSTTPHSDNLSANRLARQRKNASILFKSNTKLFDSLKSIENIKELVIPNLSSLMIVLEKANEDQMEECSTNKNVQSYVQKVEKFNASKTVPEMLSASRAMKLPKKLQVIYDSFPQWGLDSGPKYSPNVMPASTHGDELKKLQYVKESKASFAQHIRDGLLRGQKRSKLVLKAVDEKVKDTANDGKMVPTTSFYVHTGEGTKQYLVGRWQKGSMGWHYDRLPKQLLRVLHNNK